MNRSWPLVCHLVLYTLVIFVSSAQIGMTSTVAAILQQSSPPIYKLALDRIFRFATTSVLEPKLAGRYTGDLVRSAVKVDPPQVREMLTSGCSFRTRAVIFRSSSSGLHLSEITPPVFVFCSFSGFEAVFALHSQKVDVFDIRLYDGG